MLFSNFTIENYQLVARVIDVNYAVIRAILLYRVVSGCPIGEIARVVTDYTIQCLSVKLSDLIEFAHFVTAINSRLQASPLDMSKEPL